MIKNKKNTLVMLIFYLLMVGINYLSAAGFVGGNSQSSVSAEYPTVITPAGFAFSIWGVIYLSILVTILLALFRDSYSDRQLIEWIYQPFVISAIINIAWTVAFSYKLIGLSALLIVALLINVFIIIMAIAKVERKRISIYDLGFGLYGGWLAIASVVNFMAFLVSIQFNFFGNQTLFSLVVLSFFTAAMVFLQKSHTNPFFNLAIIWAFFGIIKGREFLGFTEPFFVVLILCMMILAASTLWFSRKKSSLS